MDTRDTERLSGQQGTEHYEDRGLGPWLRRNPSLLLRLFIVMVFSFAASTVASNFSYGLEGAPTVLSVEQLNREVYGLLWDWLPLPLWLTLIDPEADGAQLRRLEEVWSTRSAKATVGYAEQRQRVVGDARKRRATLPVINRKFPQLFPQGGR